MNPVTKSNTYFENLGNMFGTKLINFNNTFVQYFFYY